MGTLVKPFTYANGTVIDATELNSNLDTLYTGINGNIDTANIAANGVGTSKIADDAVTTAKILAANVTTAKIADSNITTAKIADANVTTVKIANDAVNEDKIDWGTGAGQVSLDDVPNGSTSKLGQDCSTTGSPTFVAPTFTDFTNANHAHTGASSGGALSASAITSGTFADARIAASNVTQHQAALSIAESQIPDSGTLARLSQDETVTGSWLFPSTDPPAVANAANQKGFAKAWGTWADSLATFTSSYNVDSIASNTGDGLYQVLVDRDFASATNPNDWTVVCCATGGTGFDQIVTGYSDTVGQAEIQCYDVSSATTTDMSFGFVFYGDQ